MQLSSAGVTGPLVKYAQSLEQTSVVRRLHSHVLDKSLFAIWVVSASLISQVSAGANFLQAPLKFIIGLSPSVSYAPKRSSPLELQDRQFEIIPYSSSDHGAQTTNRLLHKSRPHHANYLPPPPRPFLQPSRRTRAALASTPPLIISLLYPKQGHQSRRLVGEDGDDSQVALGRENEFSEGNNGIEKAERCVCWNSVGHYDNFDAFIDIGIFYIPKHNSISADCRESCGENLEDIEIRPRESILKSTSPRSVVQPLDGLMMLAQMLKPR
ncbi:uncharacterized protein LACBIDRAFT_334504 [Laccaria bicolor S238N-H82]|uniref:Predicted protein n=1 Tax=Laccaria bicolor (strain S238N-H82 / ATCC MYA-4686) TaxID=486041 RepID=B0DZD9_LACBS|nr:uncharacterized protein LACBIDRAFT_334504 [Laccaria bicolor S238N-H82]EDR00072.1 predicted protein [Laccaria bicolor S238N-H82]|eukprot:XP_001889278.1 predicted protein [Laccaria bicolor S238N-H82]